MAPALIGAGEVAKTVGHYVERGDASFEAIHGQGARHVALAALTAPLPGRPISRDQLKVMQKHNVVSPGALTFADLGITPTALEAVASSYLRRERG
ncbi:MAG TPA: hypothetical protein VFZ10_20180 [Geminicoccaceae bacterium]